MNSNAMDKQDAAPSHVRDVQEEHEKQSGMASHIEEPPINALKLAEKRLLRKIDFHVLPIPILLVGLSSIDRVNIASAKVAGMAKDLNLVGSRYNVAVLGWLSLSSSPVSLPRNLH